MKPVSILTPPMRIMEWVVAGPFFEKTALRRCTLQTKGERHTVPDGNDIYNKLPPFLVLKGQIQVPSDLCSYHKSSRSPVITQGKV